jgi:tRNA(Ile)-lysidine synthase
MGGPAAAVAEVRRAVRALLAPQRRDTPREAPQRGQETFLVACSGGADSLALAAAAAFEAPRWGVAAGLITVDHGLQRGSAERAQLVAQIGYDMGLDPVEVVRVDVGDDGGPEAAARTARYTALTAAAEALDAHVLLGHTLDDQAETVLLGLGRGSGPRSIAGMAVADGRYLRPLLGLRRTTTAAACTALDLPVWNDPHNSDPAFQRARLRHEVLPLLDDVLQGGVSEALARTAQLLRDDLDALDELAADTLAHLVRPSARALGPEGGQLEVAELVRLPKAIRTRVLRGWIRRLGAEPLTSERTEAVDALVTDWHGQGPIDLPGRVAVHRTSGTLVLSTQPPVPQE